MNETILRRVQILCALCGPAFVILYGLSWCVLGQTIHHRIRNTARWTS